MFRSSVVVLILMITFPLTCLAGVTIKFEGEKFPVRFVATQDGKTEVLYRPGTLKMTGEMTASAINFHTDGYFVVSRWSVNGEAKSNLEVGERHITLKDGDTVTIHVVGVIEPPNAALVPFKGGHILVSLMYPQAIVNPPDFKGKEEFRSTAMFAAKYTVKGCADHLAALAAKPVANDAFGNVRSDRQMSVIREVNADGSIIDAQAKASADELSEAIQIGLMELQIRGWHHDIAKAQELLKPKK